MGVGGGDVAPARGGGESRRRAWRLPLPTEAVLEASGGGSGAGLTGRAGAGAGHGGGSSGATRALSGRESKESAAVERSAGG